MKLQREELLDLLWGSAFFGCGGGGKFEEGLEMIDSLVGIEVADVEDIGEGIVASVYSCGSLKTEENPGWKEGKALLEMERLLGEKVVGIFATELGPYNTFAAMKVAKDAGKKFLDADGAGRAVPEIHHSVPLMKGHPQHPMTAVSNGGDVFIIKELSDPENAEKILRNLSESFGNLGVCDHPMRASEAPEYLVLRSISKAMEVGKALRENDLREALSFAGGEVIEEGRIEDVSVEDDAGFTRGSFRIGRCTVVFKNENMKAICDGFEVEFPDLIIVLRSEDLLPISNPPLPEENVLLITAKASEEWYR